MQLEQVERANLFLVPLDEVRGWWRYHHLFADLLRARLESARASGCSTSTPAGIWPWASGWAADQPTGDLVTTMHYGARTRVTGVGGFPRHDPVPQRLDL